ncbi:hypothetical protein ACILFN_01815 [Capnocytophaga canimorsus]|uniref:hypothetical protein n=1 Tax=Capnocytophaga canimorsus TaxID=28188 RepID=UPI0037CDE298
MRTIIVLNLMLFSALSFSQTKTEKMIDSVLVKNVGKTYEQYLTHFKKTDIEYKTKTDKIRSQIQERNDSVFRTLPTFPNKIYATQTYPMVVIVKNKKEYSLQDLSKIAFKAVKKSHFLNQQEGDAIFGIQGSFGVYFIEVE